MSINNSYFSKNNTIILNSYVNTGRNPVTELFYGATVSLTNPNGFSRFIFDLDLTLLREKYTDGTITSSCDDSVKHTLRMTNTSSFDEESLNTLTSQLRQRATSFDLILFRIPNLFAEEPTVQIWDEGVGYDYADLIYQNSDIDKNYSIRPSNWIERTTIDDWNYPGIYSNEETGPYPYSSLVIVDTQHFEFGNENIEFDMTEEIKGILDGTIVTSGWGIAYKPQLENLTGLTDAYEVQFFTRHTQTFYEPYLETSYNDYIDSPVPALTGLTSCQRAKGVYEVTIPPLIGFKTPCTFTDLWYGLELNGFPLPNQYNSFNLFPLSQSLQIGTNSQDPKVYGFDFYGIKQDEKIFNTDIRKVGVIIKQAYTTQKLLQKVSAYYRVYVREGQTEVQVQDWTKINRTPNEYYFIFDTRDKIPNEYYVDIKVESSSEVNTYKRTLKFQIVNYK